MEFWSAFFSYKKRIIDLAWMPLIPEAMRLNERFFPALSGYKKENYLSISVFTGLIVQCQGQG